MNVGSERLQVVLQKVDTSQPWGFRLQGGADFTTPLSVQSVSDAQFCCSPHKTLFPYARSMTCWYAN